MPHATLKKALETLGLLPVAYGLSERLRIFKVKFRNSREELGSLDDGLPIPSARLLVAIGGLTTARAYLHGGQRIAQVIEETLRQQGLEMESLSSILDFGCGSGRVIRRFHRLAGTGVSLNGCDYNPALIAWCKANLPFAAFDTNALAPPLPYESGQFDLVYSFSVFTHLNEPLQLAWLQELRRVVSAGGYLLITVHSDASISQLSDEERRDFNDGKLIVRHESVVGSNLCAAFHPTPYIRDTVARGWELAAAFDSEVGQRFVLLRKPRAIL